MICRGQLGVIVLPTNKFKYNKLCKMYYLKQLFVCLDLSHENTWKSQQINILKLQVLKQENKKSKQFSVLKIKKIWRQNELSMTLCGWIKVDIGIQTDRQEIIKVGNDFSPNSRQYKTQLAKKNNLIQFISKFVSYLVY